MHAQVAYLLAGYSGCLFAFYSLVPAVLRWSGAGVLNLSLLTANIWAALARAAFLGAHACAKTSENPFFIPQHCCYLLHPLDPQECTPP